MPIQNVLYMVLHNQMPAYLNVFQYTTDVICRKTRSFDFMSNFYIYHVPKQKITDVLTVTRRHFFGTNFLKMSETLLQ